MRTRPDALKTAYCTPFRQTHQDQRGGLSEPSWLTTRLLVGGTTLKEAEDPVGGQGRGLSIKGFKGSVQVLLSW